MKHRSRRFGVSQVTTLIAGVLLLLIVFITAGYFFLLSSDDAQPPDADPASVAFAASLAKWQEQRPEAFRYVVERHCFCPELYVEPFVAIEDGGQRRVEFPIAVEAADGSMHDTPPEPVYIADVFSAIAAALAESTPVEVRYDRQWGYPADVTIGSLAADAGYQYVIRDFDVLRYAGR